MQTELHWGSLTLMEKNINWLPIMVQTTCMEGIVVLINIWNTRILESGTGVEFTRKSRDGEEGYLGNLKCKVKYLLTDDNKLVVEYEATTDKPTVINLTNHTYFNLVGEGAASILDHELLLPGDKYVATDETNIPTEISSVSGTPFWILESLRK